jgi:hypothetical protein
MKGNNVLSSGLQVQCNMLTARDIGRERIMNLDGWMDTLRIYIPACLDGRLSEYTKGNKNHKN